MSSKLKIRNPQQHLPAEIADTPLSAALPLSTELLPKPSRGFYNSQHQSLRLSQKIGTGGEGSVFEIHGQPDLVVKIYHQPPSADKAEKLLALSRLSNDRLSKLSAWPLDVVRDYPDGLIIGFVMKKFAQAEEVHALHSPKSRLQKFPEASWAFLVYAAANVARATALMHEHGFVIGDLNPKNILVTRQATVHLLDCDSFQVTADGKQYRCEGGFPEYTPPELQGVAFRDIDRQPQHDGFGLAVIIFQLLFMGRHPFSGRYQGTGEMPLERAISEFRFAYGDDAVARQMQQPPGTLGLASLPQELVRLFQRAFLTSDRPQAHEWIAPLETLAKSLKKCALHSGHNYYQELDECPWCQIESRARIRLFNFLMPGENRAAFRLNAIWNEINSINPPEPSHLTLNQPLSPVVPSEEIVAVSRMMTAGSVIAVVAGVAIALISNEWGAAIILLMAICIIGTAMESLITAFINAAHQDSLFDRLQSQKDEAAGRVEKLTEQWNKEAGEERFIEQFNKLLDQKDSWHELSITHQQQLKKLEADTRAIQLEVYLENFEIGKTDIPGISATTKTFLLSYKIRTAADINRQRLHLIRGAGDAWAERLLEWRKSLEEKFVFDPHTGVPPQARLRLEREMDSLRESIERDLSNGPSDLRQTLEEIRASREKLTPALTEARESLSQAEKDWEIVSARKSPKAAIILLIVSFFIASMVKNSLFPPRFGQTGEMSEVGTGQVNRAMDLYKMGMIAMEAGNYQQAVRAFDEAVTIAPGHIGAQTELGYALYLTGEYDKSIEASLKAQSMVQGDFSPSYNLGLAYFAKKDWSQAGMAFGSAISQTLPRWDNKLSQAYYFHGLAITNLGQAQQAVTTIEIKLKDNPDLVIERLELGNLYMCIGNQQGAKEQYRILRKMDPDLAAQLDILIRQHKSRLSSVPAG